MNTPINLRPFYSKNNQTLALLAITFFLFCSSHANARDFYVAINGKDTNFGNKELPFKTLEHARDTIRKIKKKSGLKEAITVWIRGGNYAIGNSFVLKAEDSGSEKFPITYQAMPGETVRVSGGIKIPNSKFRPVLNRDLLKRFPKEAHSHVRQVALKSLGINDLGKPLPDRFQGYTGLPELFCNNKPMTLARWPNKGFTKIAKVIDQGSVPRQGEKTNRGGTFQYEGTRPTRWLTADAVHLKGYWCFKWSSDTIRVDKIDPKAKTIKLSVPHVYGIGGPSGGYYQAINLLEELDEPGEYFIDRKNNRLYFWSPTPIKQSEVHLSLMKETMVVLDGTSHTIFRDLTFENSRGKIFEIKNNGSHNLIVGCTIRNIATDAISIKTGVNNGVRSCDFYNIGSGGVSLAGGDRKTLSPCGHFVENCHFHHFGRLFRTYKAAIHLKGVGCKVAHNLIHSAPHSAMFFSGNDHIIERNEIHHVCEETDDAGAIYTGRDWTTYGTIIRHNHFHHIGGDTHVGNQAIYVDDVGGGVTSYGNIIRNTYRAFLIGGGRDNVMQNNILIDCNIGFHIDNRGLTWAGKGTEGWGTTTQRLKAIPFNKEPWLSKYPQLSRYFDEQPGSPIRNDTTDNLSIRVKKQNIHPVALKNMKYENNFEVETESLDQKNIFRQAEWLDFSTPKQSPIFSKIKGYELIPFEKIGLKISEYRKKYPLHAPAIELVSDQTIFDAKKRIFIDRLQLQLLSHRQNSPAVNPDLSLDERRTYEIRYTTDGSNPNEKSLLYTKPITLTETTTVNAITIARKGKQIEKSMIASRNDTVYKLGSKHGVSLLLLKSSQHEAHGGSKFDNNYAGKSPAHLGGRKLKHSIMICPLEKKNSSIRYTIPASLKNVTRFQSLIGIEDFTKGKGTAVFIVEVFRKGKWDRVYISPVIKANPTRRPRKISVNITGAEQIQLICTDGGDSANSDHATWGNPVLQ